MESSIRFPITERQFIDWLHDGTGEQTDGRSYPLEQAVTEISGKDIALTGFWKQGRYRSPLPRWTARTARIIDGFGTWVIVKGDILEACYGGGIKGLISPLSSG